MAEQHPIPSRFGAQTTAREVIDDLRLDGKTAIVTGGYAGIGVETVPRGNCRQSENATRWQRSTPARHAWLDQSAVDNVNER